MSRESRRATRRPMSGTVLVTNTMTEEVIGRIGNLSVGGLLLIASKPLVDDALYQFRFALPDNSGSQMIEVGAHVLWIDDASAPGQSWVGLRFLGLSAETTQRLRRWAEATQAGAK
ncbi:PilZ domain-containing protein [Thermomonas sp. HDW16]|uniref:PilZ domain-containing protein n=1 Tax=Thermomonas sp. HDW16 TaxID=2714945 RepID=UPI0014096A4D|nr:PilZ domain-containing protein [Thermomonas sp. HDW16]QIL19882.1 PilZ domain-containing protein [Thermomonas sp. HDW16]